MRVQCQICTSVFDDGTNPEGVLVPYIGLPQVTCPKCIAYLKQELADMTYSMNCPSCECGQVTTTWIDHEFQYGKDVELSCKIPLRSCLCGEKWLDHVAEDIMQEVIRVHLLPTVIDDEWVVAATEAAKHTKAFNVNQVLILMKSYKVPIEEMDEWCIQAREDYPCMFQANIREGL